MVVVWAAAALALGGDQLVQASANLPLRVFEAGVGRIENMLQVGFFTRRTMEQLDSDGAGNQLRALAQQLREGGMGEAEVDALMELVERYLEAMRKDVSRAA